jgi:uncharacterized protein
MNKHKFFFGILLSFLWVVSQTWAQDIPAKPTPPRLVNDFVMKLSPTEQQMLEEKLRRYADSTSTQISIVVVKSTQPYDSFDYGMKLARDWGIGQKGKNNGLLILWATEDRKVRFIVGYGLEGTITDATSKRIQQRTIVPLFKQNRFYEGLDQGLNDIFKAAAGEFDAQPKEEDNSGAIVMLVIMFFFFGIIMMFAMYKASKNRNDDNFKGPRRYRDDSWVPPITMSSWGTSSGWGGSSGGGWGSSGGGGSDFGGFGGGDFGGGGAGSDY